MIVSWTVYAEGGGGYPCVPLFLRDGPSRPPSKPVFYATNKSKFEYPIIDFSSVFVHILQLVLCHFISGNKISENLILIRLSRI